jgi:tetratricopeptide (TPR) repeat protein
LETFRTPTIYQLTPALVKNKIGTFPWVPERELHYGLRSHSFNERLGREASLSRVQGQHSHLPPREVPSDTRDNQRTAWETHHGTAHGTYRQFFTRTRRRPASGSRRDRKIHLRRARKPAEGILSCRMLSAPGLPAWVGTLRQAFGASELDRRAGEAGDTFHYLRASRPRPLALNARRNKPVAFEIGYRILRSPPANWLHGRPRVRYGYIRRAIGIGTTTLTRNRPDTDPIAKPETKRTSILVGEDWAETLAFARKIEDEGARVAALMEVASSLPAEQLAQVVGEALEVAQRIKNPIWAVGALIEIIPFLVGDQRREVLTEAMSVAQQAAKDADPATELAFKWLIPYLAGEQLAQAKAAIRNIRNTAAAERLVTEGESLTRKGRFQDGVAAFEKAIRRLSPPDHPQVQLLARAHFFRAINLARSGEDEKAWSGFETAVETMLQALAEPEAVGVLFDKIRKQLQRSPGQIDVRETARIAEAFLSDERKIINPEGNLRAFLRARGVPDELMKGAVEEAELVVIKMRVRMVPKWDDRPNELRYLTAPGFLRAMYPFLFDQSGRLEHEELVREHDPKLIRVIQQYISQRTSRHAADLGDAEGLILGRKDARGRPAKPREPASRRRKSSAPSARPR